MTVIYTMSHYVTCNSVSHNLTHDSDLWDSNHYVILLSGCDKYLEANAKILTIFLLWSKTLS